MARPKKKDEEILDNVKENTELVKEEVNKLVEEKKEDLTETKKEDSVDLKAILKLLEDSKKETDAKQAQIDSLLSIINANNNQGKKEYEKTADDVIYSLSTIMLMGKDLVSPNKEVTISLKRGETTEASLRDLREVFKNSYNKKAFEDGLCLFEDKNAYSTFRITKKNGIDVDEIVEVLKTANENKIFSYFNKVTENKHNDSLLHTLQYLIVELEYDKKFDFNTRVSFDIFEKYFGVDLKNCLYMVDIFRKVTKM